MRVLAIVLITVLFSCKSSEKSSIKETVFQEKEITFNVIKTGNNSGYQNSENIIIHNQSEMDKAWGTMFSSYMKKPPIPMVDFEINQLLLVAMGERSNGGYNIKIESIKEKKTELIVAIQESKPGENCMTTSVMSYPFQLVEIPKTNKKIVFNTVEKIYDCEK